MRFFANDVQDKYVMSSDGKYLGTVDNLVVDTKSGKVLQPLFTKQSKIATSEECMESQCQMDADSRSQDERSREGSPEINGVIHGGIHCFEGKNSQGQVGQVQPQKQHQDRCGPELKTVQSDDSEHPLNSFKAGTDERLSSLPVLALR